MSLIEFSKNFEPRTDKYDLGYIDEFYDNLFERRRNNAKNILEIGVQYGKSILLWRDYFTEATITGVDVSPCSAIENQKRIIPMYADAYNFNFVNSIPDDHYDVVIDDGPHTLDSMIFFLKNYSPKVKKGGVLVLEDIIDTSWTPILLELVDKQAVKVTVHDMRKKQKNKHLYDLWTNGLDVIVVEY
ncbi:class I SAM-dependent methyltransferase [bacterium]|nr:class I SAM-dependent methyltransferase [bacterium]